MALTKTVIALTLLASLASTCWAQSSVRISGNIDLSLRSVTNDGKTTRYLANDGMSQSWLGFSGVEDLGGGLQAGFVLESIFSADNGLPLAKFWSRRATVSLISPQWGEVRLGRDLTSINKTLFVFDPFQTNGVGAVFSLASPLGSGVTNLIRTDNLVTYFLPPALGGVYGEVQAAAGEGTPGVRQHGGRIGYRSGPLNAVVAYNRTQTATADDFVVTNAAGSYDFGAVKLFGIVNQHKWGARKLALWMAGVSAPVGPAGTLRASWTSANFSGAGTDANDATQLAVGYVHALSKRTALYASAGQIDNKGLAAFSSGNPPATPPGVPGRKSTGYEAGIRHQF